jgi:predicted SPOUT superfamily RNA methylase MTH1
MAREFWVALPDSVLSTEAALREKTLKVGQLARACAVFRVTRVYVYRDDRGRYTEDGQLLTLLLDYLDAPQYLRRHLFPRRRELDYAGALPPLETPPHRVPEDPAHVRVGDVREAMVVERGSTRYVEVGLGALVPLEGDAAPGHRATVRMTAPPPALRAEIAPRSERPDYWGFRTKHAPELSRLLDSLHPAVAVIASRRGAPLRPLLGDLTAALTDAATALLVLGAPRRGVYDILRDEKHVPEDYTRYVINFFRGQGTETVRTEEALWGALAILNVLRGAGP